MEGVQVPVSADLMNLIDNVHPPKSQASQETMKKGEKLADNVLPDISLAYLGPQIWSNTMMSDDLKLEPIDLDELLNENSLSKDFMDISSLINPVEQTQSSKSLQIEGVAAVSEGFEGHQYCMDNQALPMRENSYPNSTGDFDQFCSTSPSFVCSVTSSPSSNPNISNIIPEISPDVAQPHHPTNDEARQAKLPSQISVAEEINIPAMKEFEYEPDITDVMISTPLVSMESTSDLFDPRRRHFTDEELKPQPIIRKAKKVYVPDSNKDAKYWHKRQKNNVAAKRSREARRIKENQIAMRTKFLEKENDSLRLEVDELRSELKRMVEVVNGYKAREGKK